MEKTHVFMLKYPAMKIRGHRGGGGGCYYYTWICRPKWHRVVSKM